MARFSYTFIKIKVTVYQRYGTDKVDKDNGFVNYLGVQYVS